MNVRHFTARVWRVGLRLLHAAKRKIALLLTAPKHRIGPTHTLEKNKAVSLVQYERAVVIGDKIQKLYDDALDYLEARKLDPALYLPGNEWEQIIPAKGVRLPHQYNDVNHLRLIGPFSGYHMVILDRMDVVAFPSPWTSSFMQKIAPGIPSDIAQQIKQLYSPKKRLQPCIGEYLEYIRNVPPRYIVRAPRMFGEMGIEVDSALANPDVILCQSRINGLLCSGVLDKLDVDIARNGKARIVEIGSGHGGLAYALDNIFDGKIEYICIDLPTSLYHAAVYLSTLSDGVDCHVHMPGDTVPAHFRYLFVANYCTSEIADAIGPIDLALNAMSFPEMTQEQVRYYGELFKKVLGPDGVVYEENAAIKPHHTDIKKIFSEIYPYRKYVESSIVTTKKECQDVWSSRQVAKVFDRGDALASRELQAQPP